MRSVDRNLEMGCGLFEATEIFTWTGIGKVKLSL